MMAAYQELAPQIGVAGACRALAVNRAGVYRERCARAAPAQPPAVPPAPPLSLTSLERQQLLDLLDSERFCEMAPAGIFATLLDEGRYHGSIRTMYRLLATHHQLRERRHQRIHPVYAKPELLAVRPNQVCSWDITKLKGPVNWSCFHLYVILDIFRRYVVGSNALLERRPSRTALVGVELDVDGSRQQPALEGEPATRCDGSLVGQNSIRIVRRSSE